MRRQLAAGVAQRVRAAIDRRRADIERVAGSGGRCGMLPVRDVQAAPLPGGCGPRRAASRSAAMLAARRRMPPPPCPRGNSRCSASSQDRDAETGLLHGEIEQARGHVLGQHLALPMRHEGLEHGCARRCRARSAVPAGQQRGDERRIAVAPASRPQDMRHDAFGARALARRSADGCSLPWSSFAGGAKRLRRCATPRWPCE